MAAIQLEKISVQKMKGISAKRAEALATVGITSIQDLLEYTPRRHLDRSMFLPINKLEENTEATVMGDIIEKKKVFRGKRRLIVSIHDGKGILEGVWFNQVEIFDKIFEKRQTVAFSGKITRFKTWQMVHPDFDIIGDNRDKLHTGQIIPIYPGSEALRKAGLNSYSFRRIISDALKEYQRNIAEILPAVLIKKYKLLSRAVAFRQMHFPESAEKLKQVFRRFKYEELFFLELLMALRKHFYQTPAKAVQMDIDNALIRKVVDSFPFQLTGAQREVLKEIYQDLRGGHPMNRLLQGDVGSGKTVVALVTMLMAISSGYQAALMAPTEILAQQHYFNVTDLVKVPLNIEFLIGSLSPNEKEQIHRKIAKGEIDLVIGTHALIQESVQFRKLGLVIVDEQHRFGVMQRAELIKKGLNPHVLVMTATPIPRSLALTLYGDLDVSIINELPPGRQQLRTFWRKEGKLNLIHEFIRQKVGDHQQVYIIYPLIEESEKMDLKAATDAYHYLKRDVFPEFKLALLHGRLKMEEKAKIMGDFKQRKVHILISTTVIEVGVDIPNATIMVIEHAERFGLSQLHQLRGRVGRGEQESFCILVTPEDINEIAQRRMKVLEKSNDGFFIADEDLRLRGSGEFFGTRQHGMPDLSFADLIADKNIVQTARKDAFEIVRKDPRLLNIKHQMAKEYFVQKFREKFYMKHIA
jgi:ATP-dependent DNA helicase RecG